MNAAAVTNARLIRVEARPADAALLWRSLVSGTRRVTASYCSEAGCYLELQPTAVAAQRPSPKIMAVLEQILLGVCQKVIAIDSNLSPATIANRALRGALAIGLEGQLSALPIALVILVQSAHGLVASANPQVSTLAPDGHEIVTLPLPKFRSGLRLTTAERELLGYMLEGRSRKEMASLRRSSARTIANQLGSIYRKLGVTGRVPLITRIVEKNGYCSRSPAKLTEGYLASSPEPANLERLCV